jgi:hypothetical protein
MIPIHIALKRFLACEEVSFRRRQLYYAQAGERKEQQGMFREEVRTRACEHYAYDDGVETSSMPSDSDSDSDLDDDFDEIFGHTHKRLRREEPVEQVEQAEPDVEPDEQAEPDEPAEQAEPDEPAEQAEPDEPAEQAEPDEPAEPVIIDLTNDEPDDQGTIDQANFEADMARAIELSLRGDQRSIDQLNQQTEEGVRLANQIIAAGVNGDVPPDVDTASFRRIVDDSSDVSDDEESEWQPGGF